jgi:hypothetical protein
VIVTEACEREVAGVHGFVEAGEESVGDAAKRGGKLHRAVAEMEPSVTVEDGPPGCCAPFVSPAAERDEAAV